MTDRRNSIGKKGEALAVEFLKKNGYRILENNFRCRYGEIDIIAAEGETLSFVEVKTKTSINFGPPQTAVDLRKQRQISKVALFYLTSKGLVNNSSRFDVIGIIISENSAEIKLIKNAFELCLR